MSRKQTQFYFGAEPAPTQPKLTWDPALDKQAETTHNVPYAETPIIDAPFLIHHVNGRTATCTLIAFQGRKAQCWVSTASSDVSLFRDEWSIPVYDTRTMKAGIPLKHPMWYLDKYTLARLRKTYWSTKVKK